MANMKNPVKAIHAFCVDCMGGHESYIKTCTTETCPLHPFRMGKNPYLKREMSQEQIEEFRQRMKHYREVQEQKKLKENQYE